MRRRASQAGSAWTPSPASACLMQENKDRQVFAKMGG